VGLRTPPPAFDFNAGLRPLVTEVPPSFPFFDLSTAVKINGVAWYPQGTPAVWQAEWRTNPEGREIPVAIDWGDALSSRRYTTNSMVRIEAVLLQDETVVTDPLDTMVAYNMMTLAGSKETELKGTDGSTAAGALRTVFTVNARLRIEKLQDAGPSVVVFDKAIHEGFGTSGGPGGHGGSGGPGGGGGSQGGPPLRFSGELNGSGKVVYGSNFMLRKVALPDGVSKAGQWRITLSIDPESRIGARSFPGRIRIVGQKDAKTVVAPDGLGASIVLDVQ
jgi:hypothetical protein